MSPHLRTLFAGLALALTAAGSSSAVSADDANVVKYRQTFMSATGAHLGMISAAMKGEVGFTDQIASNAEAIALLAGDLAANAEQMFPEGTDEAGGYDTASLPAIWENWAGFTAAVQQFQEEATTFAEVAQGGDMAAIGQQMAALGRDGCGTCHSDFRKRR